MKQRVNQVIFCKAAFFAPRFKKKYNLVDYYDQHEPVIFHGLHTKKHYRALQEHKGKIIVIWCGGGLSRYTTSDKVSILKTRPDIKHISTSTCIKKQLDKLGIENELLPIIGELPNIEPHPPGDKIYGYKARGKFYGRNLSDRIERETGLEIVYTSVRGSKNNYHTTFNDDQLREIYKQCFIGIRLTPYDGTGATCVELGLMGRRCIFNGDPPNCIKWQNDDNVITTILKEYENRDNIDYYAISQSVKDFIDIGEDWLYV